MLAASSQLERMAARSQSRLVTAYARHGSAKAARDGTALSCDRFGLDATAVDLTRREAQLVELAREGLSNAEIADRLVLSVRTVETHLYRGMQKLGIKDRWQASDVGQALATADRIADAISATSTHPRRRRESNGSLTRAAEGDGMRVL